jgi:Altronate dehydratase
LPASICATDVCRIVSDQVKGTVTFHNQNGCSQTASDFKLTLEVMTGFAANPNIYGTVVISLGCEVAQMDLVVKAIQEKTNKPIRTLIIQEEGGTLKTVSKAVRYANELVAEASQLQREEFPVSELIVGTNCGGSDPTSGLAANPVVGALSDRLVELGATSILCETTEFIGAEDILAEKAENEHVKNRIYEIIERYEQSIKIVGESLRDGQPAAGNKKSGLSTIEEKTLGCIHKGGHTKIQEVMDYAQYPTKKGLVIMDTPGNDSASVAGLFAGGAHLVVFTTGLGTPTGNPIGPVLKLTGNSRTFKNMEDNLDVDVSSIISGESTVAECAETLLKEVISVANGKMVKAEVLGFREIAIMRTCNYL